MTGVDEQELLAGVLAGDADALDALLARAYPALVLLAGGPEAEVRRVVEEACCAVFGQRVAGEPPEELRLRLRAAVLQRVPATAADAAPVAAVPPSCFDPPGSAWAGWWTDEEMARSAGDAAAGRLDARPEATGALLAALRDLPLGERAVVVLRDVEGWSAAEVEELLGLPARRQRSRLHAARSRLRAAVDAVVTTRPTGPPGHPPPPAVPDYDFSCQQLVEATTDFLGGAYTPRERAFLEQHLLVCLSCVVHLHQVEATISLVGGLPVAIGGPPAELRAAVLAAFEAAG